MLDGVAEAENTSAKKILPDDMTGKSVLGVGPASWDFCVEALQRGADQVVGIDIDCDRVRKARQQAACLGLRASFQCLDIESDPLPETFDYVLCFEVLHHARNPLVVLDRLVALAHEWLVLDVVVLGRRSRKKTSVSHMQQFFLNRSPIIFVSGVGASGNKTFPKFFITPSAMKHLLMVHRTACARVEAFPSDQRDRYLVVARKRRIGKLIVVAGPAGAGKSVLIEKLRRDEVPEIAERVGINDGSAWTTVQANRLVTLNEPFVEKLILHYNFLRTSQKSAKVPKRDEAMDLLATAEQVTFLTLWCPPEVLRERWEKREVASKTTNEVYRGGKRRLLIAEEYGDPARVRTHYQNWFEYTRTKPGSHVIVSLVDGVQFYSREEWEAEVSSMA